MARLIILFLLVTSIKIHAQLITSFNEADSLVLTKYIRESRLHWDSVHLVAELNAMLGSLYGDGYLEAAYTIHKNDTVLVSEWVVGTVYQWAFLKPGNLPEYLLNKIGFKDKFYSDRPFKLKDFSRLFDKVLTESEDSGFPFAYVILDSLKISSGTISGVINYEPGPEITFDRLSVQGTDRISTDWLAAYLNIREGSTYSQKVIDEVINKMERLPFLELTSTPSITFKNLQAEVELSVNYKKSNNLDGIIGFLPNEQQEGELLITGQLYLGLKNLFNSGKSLLLEWQSLKARSQLLNIEYTHPNLLRSPFDIGVKFNLLKEDTLFVNRELDIATLYKKPQGDVSLFYRSRSSSVLSQLPVSNDVTDFSINYYGLGYSSSSTNYGSGNNNGFQFKLEAAVGSKEEQVLLMDSVEEMQTEERSIQYQFTGAIAKKIKISRSFNWFVGLQGGVLLNENDLYINDLFRIGGLRTIRGFNENFFFADKYSILKTELRLYYQPESFLFLFYDQGYLTTVTLNAEEEDYPLGLGAGMSLKVKGGLINIAYGIGHSNEQEFDFRLSKFHFGYVARF